MFNRTRALDNFKEAVNTWHNSSIALVSAAAVVFVIGAYSKTEKRTYNEVMEELKEITAEKNIKQAMVYKYLGLARQLVLKLVHDNPDHGGQIAAILACKAPSSAQEIVLEYLHKNKISSLDKLSIFLGGGYQRSASDREKAAGTTQDNLNAANNRAAAKPAAVVKAVTASPVALMQEVANALDDEKVIKQMIEVLEDRLQTVQREHRKANKTGRRNGRHANEPAVQIAA